MVHQDLVRGLQMPHQGRPGMTARQVLRVMLIKQMTQLSYQDPLKPLDNQEFIAQMAQFTSLDQTRQLNDKLAQLLSTQSSLQSVGLIGKTAEFKLESGETLAGTVTALSFAGETPELTITASGGQTISGLSLSQIVSVR